MSDTKNNNPHGTRAPRGSRPGGGSRRRPGGGGPPGRRLSPTTRGTLRTEPVTDAEVVSWRTGDPAEFRRLFDTALRLASVEAPGVPAEVVRARATAQTWRTSVLLDAVVAEAARVEVFEAWLQETGRSRLLRADLDPVEPVEPDDEVEGDEVEPVEPEAPKREGERATPRVPRGRPLPGDRIRRGGSR